MSEIDSGRADHPLPSMGKAEETVQPTEDEQYLQNLDVTTTAIVAVHKKEEPDKGQIQQYVSKMVNLQKLSKTEFAKYESDFYDKAHLIIGEIPESSFLELEKAINERLECIIFSSRSFLETVSEKLTKEERALYLDLHSRINDYVKMMCEKIRMSRHEYTKQNSDI